MSRNYDGKSMPFYTSALNKSAAAMIEGGGRIYHN